MTAAPITSPTLASYVGLNNLTGAEISGDDHLMQSLRDIITTPIGTRVMRRTYGSLVPSLIDSPMTAGLVADIVASVAQAVIAWEPRVILQRVIVNALSAGGFTLGLVVQANGQTLRLDGVI